MILGQLPFGARQTKNAPLVQVLGPAFVIFLDKNCQYLDSELKEEIFWIILLRCVIAQVIGPTQRCIQTCIHLICHIGRGPQRFSLQIVAGYFEWCHLKHIWKMIFLGTVIDPTQRCTRLIFSVKLWGLHPKICNAGRRSEIYFKYNIIEIYWGLRKDLG